MVCGFLAIFPALAQAERGWLVYEDGNRISGEFNAASGVFTSDRFGEIAFSPADAVFEPEGGEIAGSAEEQAPATGDPEPSPLIALNEKAGKGFSLWPTNWSITASYMWKEEDSNREYEVDLALDLFWEWYLNELSVNFRTEYEYQNGDVDTNEQTGRLRWLNTFRDPFFVMADGYLERNQISPGGVTYDYLMLQGALGAGVGRQFNDRFLARAAILYNWVSIDILESSLGGTVNAFSLFAEIRYDFSERLRYSHWGKIYFWEDSSEGFESEAELRYKLTSNVSLGLRHLFMDETATLQSEKKNEVQLFTRVTF